MWIMALTGFGNLFLSLEWLDYAAVVVSERKLVDAVAEVVVLRSHQLGQVRMSPHERNGLACSDVKVTRHLVELQGPVDAAGIVWLVRLDTSM